MPSADWWLQTSLSDWPDGLSAQFKTLSGEQSCASWAELCSPVAESPGSAAGWELGPEKQRGRPSSGKCDWAGAPVTRSCRRGIVRRTPLPTAPVLCNPRVLSVVFGARLEKFPRNPKHTCTGGPLDSLCGALLELDYLSVPVRLQKCSLGLAYSSHSLPLG